MSQDLVSRWRKTYHGARVFDLVLYSLALPSISMFILLWSSISLQLVVLFPILYLGYSVVAASGFHQLFSFALLVLAIVLHFLAVAPFSWHKFPLAILAITCSALCITLSPFQRWVYVPNEVDTGLPELIDCTYGNCPSDGPFIADIVIVHGLATNAATTLASGTRAKRSSITFWPRDLLAFEDKLDCRIFMFSYDSAYQGNALTKDLAHCGNDLLRAIKKKRQHDEEATRPLILIGHSYSGLIIKQMLVSARDKNEEVYKHAVGIIFLGTPHKGSRLTRFGIFLSYFSYWSGSRSSLLDVIQTKSTQNTILYDKFMDLRQQHDFLKYKNSIVCCFEAVRDSFLGFATTHVVEPESAVMDSCEEIGFEVRQRELQRVEDNEHYEDILFYIKEWTEKCKDRVASKLESERVRVAAQRREIAERKVKENHVCLASLYFREMDTWKHQTEYTHRAEGTCSWILRNENYKNWSSQDRKFLWIKGRPGTGKSVLTYYAYQKALEDQKKSSGDLVIAAFFCHDRGATLQKTLLGLFRSLLDQILPQIPELLEKFGGKYLEKCRQSKTGQRWEWSEEELGSFIRKELPEASKEYAIRIFVDAMDEFGVNAARDLMDYFRILLEKFLSNGTRIKICFSCQHHPLAESYNSTFTTMVEKENGKDIETYFTEKTESHQSEIKKIEVLQQAILAKANGVFLWVHLSLLHVLPHLDDWSAKELLEEIEGLPSELEELYRHTFGRLEPRDQQKTRLLLQWICFAVRPLTPTELQHAILLDADVKSIRKLEESNYFRKSPTDLPRLVKRLSCGLAEITDELTDEVTDEEPPDEQRVQFIHQSVKDYLIKSVGLKYFDDSSTEGHGDHLLSRLCLHYLTIEEIIQLKDDDITTTVSEFSLLRYAMTSWTIHAEGAEAQHISQVDLFSSLNCSEEVFLKQWIRMYQRIGSDSISCPVGGTTLLHILCRHRLVSLLSARLNCEDKAKADAKDDDGRTPLSWAAESGHEAVVKLLLEQRVDADSKDNYGQTPLSWAARKGHAAVVELLLEQAVDADLKDTRYEQSPLSWAAENGQEVVVKLLLKQDVDVNSRNYFNRTPLSWAAENGYEAIVKLLLEQDVDVDPRDCGGQTPLLLAAERGHEAVVKILLELAVEVDLKDHFGRTPLSWASSNGCEAVVKLLLKQAVDADSKDEFGRTPLSWAAGIGHETIVKLLLEHAVDADSKDKNNQTPLSRAAEKGHEAVVKLLLEHAVDVAWEDSYDHTPLSWAVENGHEAVLKLLKSKMEKSQ